MNLNRVYGNPSLLHNPTIYAARKLILYAHLGKDVQDPAPAPANPIPLNTTSTPNHELTPSDTDSVKDTDASFTWEIPTYRNRSVRASSSSRSSSLSYPSLSPWKQQDYGSQWYEMTENSRCSEGDESIADFSVLPCRTLQFEESAGLDLLGPPATSPAKSVNRMDFLGAFSSPGCQPQPGTSYGTPSRKSSVVSTDEDTTNDKANLETIPTYPKDNGDSGLFMYLDIHGHASKRGIFMYGNYFEDTETKIDALLFPKLMSINSANFDFPACNFTERNMFLKDRHTGAGREGSGRVSVYRATGISYCYTLECNFNTGRFTNNIPLASRDFGRATPPPSFDIPPKYNPAIYEETGKYMAISILDLTESNPWTRLTCSASKTLKGTRNWIRNYIKSAELEAANKSKSVKSSPIRSRLRNMAGIKKSAIKQLKLSIKSPSGLETPRSLATIPRKIQSTKNSQSTSGKLSRQTSAGSGAGGKLLDVPEKRSRPGSSKLKKLKRPGSKTGPKPLPKIGSKPGSRSTSPRRLKSDAKQGKPGLVAKGKKLAR